MTDDQVEGFILKELKRKRVTYWDMKFGPEQGIDPSPDDKETPLSEKGIRENRFVSSTGYDRMRELLCVGKFNKWDDYQPLKISFHDLFRFWWNRCIIREYMVEDVLTEIFEHFVEKMMPPEKEEEEEMDMEIDFDEIPLPSPRLKKAA